MPPDTKPTAIFARHETFHPRFGWLKKGYDKAQIDPQIFLRDDAPIRLGVGKNMVRSIRYWCTAFHVLEESDRTLTATSFGQHLLGDQGYDPFLEDPASLWLLHWSLLKPPCLATAWDIAFNQFPRLEFSSDELFLALCDYRDTLGIRIADSSLRKDVTCLLRMYTAPDRRTNLTEDAIDCPFTGLHLLYEAGQSKRYEFQMGPKDGLPAAIIVATCLDFVSQSSLQAGSIALSRLAFDPGSPGMVFKLTEGAIATAIEAIALHQPQLKLSTGAGLMQFQYPNRPDHLAQSLLDQHYQPSRD
ncbi:MAG: DUF4007 family protein [Leptolyngbya sp. DLM2.Bin15]|nr:MAG: DUF4007 family protein [Leptolyngbya sp. DLM2.Bin15]